MMRPGRTQLHATLAASASHLIAGSAEPAQADRSSALGAFARTFGDRYRTLRAGEELRITAAAGWPSRRCLFEGISLPARRLASDAAS